MTAPKMTPRREEREFTFSELFFSTTDEKGIIRYGNNVFARIAGYELEELRGAPHNIIRHPDMPQSAFKLVWDFLKQGKVVAAYVKNMAKDGCYYWVMALIMPCDGGYLSIRLKPSSDYFVAVQRAYQDVLEVERLAASNGGTSKEVMEAGHARLVELLATLGFASYDAFMWSALSTEMTIRERRRKEGERTRADALTPRPVAASGTPDRQLDHIPAVYRHCIKLESQLSVLFSKLDTFSHLGAEISPKTDFILRLGEQIRLLSTNAEIQSARLGESGAALSAIASQLGHHSTSGTQTIARLNSKLTKLEPIISALVFNTTVAKLKIEMTTHFLEETIRCDDAPDIDTNLGRHVELRKNIHLLIQSFLTTAREILSAINHLQGHLGAVDQEAGNMEKFIHTLNMINLTGKIETARSDATRSFTAIFEQVQNQTHAAEREISEFLDLINVNTAQLASINDMDERTFSRLESLMAG